jgi:hypothetical protein
MKDPIVAEVRKYRMEHTNKFHGDIHEICNDIKNLENKLKRMGCINKDNKFVPENFNRELFLSEKQN